MSDFISRINSHFEGFTPSHKTVASYLIDNQTSAAFSTLDELADRIGVSTTTIIRFSRELGYSGYSDMQKNIRSSIQNKATLPERLLESYPLEKGDSLLRESFRQDIENIESTLASIDHEDLERAIELINNARRIMIMGMRSSFALAHYLTSRLGEIRDDVRLVQSTGMIYPEEIVGVREGDVCIAYMFPRYSRTTGISITWMRKQGVKVILITSLNKTAVIDYGDIVLPCAVNSVSYKNSLAAPMCLTNYIAAALARSKPTESRELLKKTETILSQGYYLGL